MSSNKLREALSDACYAMFNFLKTQNGGYEEMANALDKAKAALVNPPCNCDVGTPQEQIKRWEKFCQEHHEQWKPSKSLTAIQRCNCPCHEGNGCNYFIWAQMPYEKEGEA